VDIERREKHLNSAWKKVKTFIGKDYTGKVIVHVQAGIAQEVEYQSKEKVRPEEDEKQKASE
jgi:hypothetical protein